MSRRPWTRCRSSSTAVSRRSEAAAPSSLRAGLAAALLLLGAAAPLAAQAIELSMQPGRGVLVASLSFRWARPEEVVASLRRGLESRITFTTRLYEARTPAFSFAGDRLLAEKTVRRSAFWDFLDQVFVVEEEERQTSYADAPALIRGLFSVQETFALASGDGRRRKLYVAARAQFEPVRLMPPLTIVGLAGAATTVATPWVRWEVP